jgi:hypothetical protein
MLVSKQGCQHPGGLGGPADTREELFDQVQGNLWCLPGHQRVGAWKLDQFGVRDVLG